MLHKIFFAQNRMMTPVVPTYAVTFTVKEFLIDPDNSFADTEIGVLQYMTVKIGSETKLTNASGQAVFNLESGTHVYEIYDNDRYLTTVRGEVTVVSSTESVMAKVYPCLYTPLQVWNMIEPPAWIAGTYDAGWHVNKSGTIYVALLETSEEPGVETDWEVTGSYIPVASGANLNDLRTTASRTMGQGSIFEGTFTTGLNKYYLQTNVISLVDYQTGAGWNPIGTYAYAGRFYGRYNGANLFIKDFLLNRAEEGVGLFRGYADFDGSVQYKNIRLQGNVTNNAPNSTALLAPFLGGANSVVDNCFVYGTVTVLYGSLTSYVGGFFGVSGLGAKILNSKFIGEITAQSSSSSSVGGIVALHRDGDTLGLIDNCTVENSVISGTTHVGGIVGENYGTVSNSQSINNSISAAAPACGGVVGYNRRIIEDCYNSSSVTINAASSYGAGGVAGVNYLLNYQAKIYRSYNTGSITHSGTGAYGTGGITGINRNGLIENSYSHGSVSGVTNVGGGVGQHRTSISRNCYSTGSVTGTTAVGGYSGITTSGSTYTNCYYDSQTSSRSDTGKGNPRTTAQMKEGTASSFILPAGGTDPDSLAANAMYTSWDDVDTWDFGTTSEYPTLK